MNDDFFEKVEEYLNGEMSNEDKSNFEASLSSNEELSAAFKVYSTIETEMRSNAKYGVQESELKESLQVLNAHYFDAEPQQTARIFQLYPNKLYRITAAIAASIIVVVVSYFVFFRPDQNIQRLANNYYNSHLQQLSQTLDNSNDSLQLGIAAYNNKEYDKALQYFQEVYQQHPNNSEAKKNIGLVYLATKDYDKALQHFEELANRQNLYSNPGLFLQAVTLMQRNKEGDKQKAQQLLQQVVNEKAEGSREAEEWLKKF